MFSNQCCVLGVDIFTRVFFLFLWRGKSCIFLEYAVCVCGCGQGMGQYIRDLLELNIQLVLFDALIIFMASKWKKDLFCRNSFTSV